MELAFALIVTLGIGVWVGFRLNDIVGGLDSETYDLDEEDDEERL